MFEARERLAVALLLAVVVWIVHFSHVAHLGFYEDDWAFIGEPMTWTCSRAFDWLTSCLRHWPQGRPIGYGVVTMVAFVGGHTTGLIGIFIVAFTLHSVNTVLVYFIARHHLAAAPSFCAALAFGLFPSVTSTPMVEAQLFISLTLFFLLLATWLFIRGSRTAAYLVSIGSLLTYESGFLPFLGAPLLGLHNSRCLRRALAKHWSILLGIGAALFFARSRMSEAKVLTVLGDGVAGTLVKVATAVTSGPVTTFRLFFKRIRTVLRDGDREVFVIAIILAIVFTAALCLLRAGSLEGVERWPLSRFRIRRILVLDRATASALRLGAAGLLMIPIGYALAISGAWYPPVVENGRLTGAHLAASVGSALLCGAVVAIVLDLGSRYKVVTAFLVACYFAGLGGFHHMVQHDFLTSWRVQRAFWASVKNQCPDLKDGTILIYEMEPPPTRYIATNSWGDSYVLHQTYVFPSNWKERAVLYSVVGAWANDIVVSEGHLMWPTPISWLPPRELVPGNVILLRGPALNPKRVSGAIPLKGREFPLKDPGSSPALSFPPGPLHKYVFE